MKMKPRDPKESFFARGAGTRAVLGGLLIGALTLVAFYWGLREFGYGLGSRQIPDDVLAYARTMAFVVLAAAQLFYSLAMRDAVKSIFKVGLFSNLYLVGAIIGGLMLQLGVISVPFLARSFKVQMLSAADWVLVITLALVPLICNEIVKLFIRHFQFPD
jgi:Ca2+-transporting ATPase